MYTLFRSSYSSPNNLLVYMHIYTSYTGAGFIDYTGCACNKFSQLDLKKRHFNALKVDNLRNTEAISVE